MLRPERSGVLGSTGLPMDSLPFIAATMIAWLWKSSIAWASLILTSVEMGLFSQLIVRVTIGIDGPIQLLEAHEGMDEFIVCMEQAT